MSSDANFEPEVDVSGTTPPVALTANQSLARVFMAEGNGRYTVILPDSSAALALKSGATDGTKPEKPEKGGRKGAAKNARGGGKTRGGKASRGTAPAFTGMGRMGCNGFGRCNGSCLDRGGKTCNGGVRAGPASGTGADTETPTSATTPTPTPTPEEPPKKNRVLVDLHSAFHHTIRVSRHSIVVVDLAKAPESLKRGSRVVGTIINVVRNPEVWCKAAYWPYAQFEAPTKTEDTIVGQLPPSDSEDEEDEQ
ncbi:hypothetical protein SCUCBS95973_001130 [Sporothrix curviconia]|uniref:S1-like domain-containing protein n=1 Tax=Sporothrix curviconia TaxID=1260050 RepID=A0ABP0AW29_9PEZI